MFLHRGKVIMIIDNIKNAQRYNNIHQDLEKVFEFLNSLSFGVTPGTYYVDGRIKVSLDTYMTKPVDECKFENHKKFADVHYVVTGHETIDVTSDELKVIEDKLDESDYALYESGADYTRVTLKAREFAIVFPGEKHRPLVAVGDSQWVLKAIAKIEIDG